MKYLYWNVPFYAVLNILLIMRNCLQALGNKKLPVIASIVELIGKFAGAFLLSRMIGYLGICLFTSYLETGLGLQASHKKNPRCPPLSFSLLLSIFHLLASLSS